MLKIANKFLNLAYNSSKKQFRLTSYQASPFVCDLPESKTKFEISKDPNEWEYVERLLPRMTVPEPLPKEHYPSGWQPQSSKLNDKPYFISRTKNHMMPVYLKVSENNTKRETVVKKIQGDIWLLERELRNFLQEYTVKPIRSQVNEIGGLIYFHGDHVNAVKYYIKNKGY